MSFKSTYLRTCFWINDFFHGSSIRSKYNEIKYLQEHSIAEGKNIRETYLCSILSWAQKNTEFYSRYKSFDLTDYPVMNKMLFIENFEKLRIPENCIPNQKEKVHIQKTSGSTGTPLAMPQDTQKRLRRIAELKYFGKIVGFKSHDKLIHLRTWNRWQNKTAKQIKTENIIPFDISKMGEEELSSLLSLVYAEKATCLRGYASSLGLLASYAKEHPYQKEKSKYLKIAIAGSESLQDDVRKNVKQYLGCEIISQYANEECGILAQERIPTKDSDNVMYLNHSGYIFEFLKMDSDESAEYGEPGRIVLTDLHNMAFPIIRYDTGDVGVLMPPDEYSHGYPVLGKLYGRRLDLIYSTTNDVISPMTFARTLKHYDDIVQWQFIQKGAKEYCLKLILRNENKSLFSELSDQFRKICGDDSDINIIRVEDIPVLASGKRKPVVNEWKGTIK